MSSSPQLYKCIFCSVGGISLGILAFITTQTVIKDFFDPIVNTCNSGLADEALSIELQPYEPLLGGPFVCMITQFLYFLSRDPAGILAWGVIAQIGFVIGFLMYIEAGRQHARGIITYPVIVSLLGQVLGISVIFPALWLPGYLYARYMSDDSFSKCDNLGLVTIKRIYASILVTSLFSSLTILLFTLDKDSYYWTVTAGVLGGPLIALVPLPLGIFAPAPIESDDASIAQQITSAKTAAKMYNIIGSIIFFGWLTNIYLAYGAFQGDLDKVLEGLWLNAHPSVAFMTIDTGILYIATIMYIFIHDVNQAFITILITPIIGPGSASAFALANIEAQQVEKFSSSKKRI